MACFNVETTTREVRRDGKTERRYTYSVQITLKVFMAVISVEAGLGDLASSHNLL